MKKIYSQNPWKIIEKSFSIENHEMSESVFSLGNGLMGQRANFEEDYSGKTLQGSYVAGVFYPDKTKVGWWKNGYPDYFAKVLNAPAWIDIRININNTVLDLAKTKILSFERVLDMQHGTLSRSSRLDIGNGKIVSVSSKRFVSIVNKEIGAIEFNVIPENFDADIVVELPVDASISNKDSNYDHGFWDVLEIANSSDNIIIKTITKETKFNAPRFTVATGISYHLQKNNIAISSKPESVTLENYAAHKFSLSIAKGENLKIHKYGCITSTLYYANENLIPENAKKLEVAKSLGFESLLKEHSNAWLKKWETSDIEISGDVEAQQAIRFNIFHLIQTYSGEDSRFNIGPKGFTGEKYGGSTYWDTEAFCFPFYLSTASHSIARNLLLYRYKQLPNAIKNAEKLGFKNGAALFPMVTMTGEECHNEWEITFEEIHRNGAIAHAVFDYIDYTNDIVYLEDYGLELLAGIARFWAQRVNFSSEKNKFVILGVTGPNEYENNVSNNWYTNYFAKWCLSYAKEAFQIVGTSAPQKLAGLNQKIQLSEDEVNKWGYIAENIFLSFDGDRKIFVQQDGFFDKEIIPVSELDPSVRPLNQKWSWDRILRSCYIKQADVVQGLYVFEDDFDIDTIKSNFYFYEPITVHESSLSPSIHSIVASKIGDLQKAYSLYLRTARLDLDDYNNEAHEGLHITSMAGTWLSIVKGFAGFRVRKGKLFVEPSIPEAWQSFSFSLNFNETKILIKISKTEIEIKSDSDISIYIKGNIYKIEGNKNKIVNY